MSSEWLFSMDVDYFGEYFPESSYACGFVGRDYGILRYAGEDALNLLSRMSTNALMELPDNHGIETVLTSAKGRIVDVVFVLRQGQNILMFTSPGNNENVLEWIDRYTIMEDAVVQDITGKFEIISVMGPDAAKILSLICGIEVEPIEEGSQYQITQGGPLIVRRDFGGVRSYDVISTPEYSSMLQTGLIEAGLINLGCEILESIRIREYIRRFGAELTDAFNPLEAGLISKISFTKGCYIGQEVIARLNTYDKVQKCLVGFKSELGKEIEPNTRLMKDGKQVGIITSSIIEPTTNSWIGLGYIRKREAISGASLLIDNNDTDVKVVLQNEQ